MQHQIITVSVKPKVICELTRNLILIFFCSGTIMFYSGFMCLAFTNAFILDHKCGYCSILPNLKSKFGWNPAKRLTRWLTGLIETKTGDGQTTFKQVCSITH